MIARVGQNMSLQTPKNKRAKMKIGYQSYPVITTMLCRHDNMAHFW
jgi:hypothetical protein